jgi:hypothetical protein
LIIAGGGGGKSYALGREGYAPVLADGGLSDSGSGTTGTSVQDSPGAGGGWAPFASGNIIGQEGRALLEGGIGGETCPQAKALGWDINGGFGGGGGGCTAGGGGGGYSGKITLPETHAGHYSKCDGYHFAMYFAGGNASLANDIKHNGQGGSSYISPDGQEPRFVPGTFESPARGTCVV